MRACVPFCFCALLSVFASVWGWISQVGSHSLLDVCVFFVVNAMCMFFLDWFRRQAAISCYMCDFFVFLCVFMLWTLIFIGVADRPPLIARCVTFLLLGLFEVHCMVF